MTASLKFPPLCVPFINGINDFREPEGTSGISWVMGRVTSAVAEWWVCTLSSVPLCPPHSPGHVCPEALYVQETLAWMCFPC